VDKQKEQTMRNRYWEAGEVPEVLLDWVNAYVVAAIKYWKDGEVPEVLLDWVNENVVAAIKDCWEDDKPVAWANFEDGRMVLTVTGPGKPTAEDPSGYRDNYTLTFDVLEELRNYSAPYEEIGGPHKAADLGDMRERAAVLRKLADEVAALAARAAEAG
jgi:hypothetical protein